jgi:hypothetical protein
MRNPWKLTTFFLIALVALMFGKNAVTGAVADPQPRMQDALGHLLSARESLEAASRDKGGHRNKAIAATNQAIKQVEAGIRYDNRHRGDNRNWR